MSLLNPATIQGPLCLSPIEIHQVCAEAIILETMTPRQHLIQHSLWSHFNFTPGSLRTNPMEIHQKICIQ